MSKEHKIVVTRDDDRFGEIDIWSISARLIYREGVYLAASHNEITRICVPQIAKKCLGFTPRKGSKQVIIIKRAEK